MFVIARILLRCSRMKSAADGRDRTEKSSHISPASHRRRRQRGLRADKRTSGVMISIRRRGPRHRRGRG